MWLPLSTEIEQKHHLAQMRESAAIERRVRDARPARPSHATWRYVALRWTGQQLVNWGLSLQIAAQPQRCLLSRSV